MSDGLVVEERYEGRKPLLDARVGDDLGRMEFRITGDRVARNAWANDDYNPWYLDRSPFSRRIVSPVYVASFDAKLFYGYYSYPEGGSLFAKQEFEYHAPVFVDEPYELVGEMVQIYERRGRTFFRARIAVVDRNANEPLVMHKTVAAPVDPCGSG